MHADDKHTPPQLAGWLKRRAAELGFDAAGICAAQRPGELDRFRQWLERGYAGEMHYLQERWQAYQHPRHVLADARSILVLTMNYRTAEPRPPGPGQGMISRYAWGEADYHDVIHQRLKRLAESLRQRVPRAAVRGVVDTAPLLERELARAAGVGWVGKNTLLLRRSTGSWFFLAALLTDQFLPPDEPFATDHCGSCTACLDACPTDAFPQPYVLDATRCISYLTIELRTSIPRSLRTGIGNWLFGCDICQDVCPWNRRAPSSEEPAFSPRSDSNPVDLAELFEMTDEAFRHRFRQTPLWRSKRRGLLRNAAIVLGNQRHPAAVRPLTRALDDTEPVVRAAAAWALGRLNVPAARAALGQRHRVEPDADVRRELELALAAGDESRPSAPPD